MKYTIMGFNQKVAIDLGLDLIDLALLNWLSDFYPAMEKIIIDKEQYAWINYKYVLSEVPILGIGNKRCLARRLDKLCEKRLIKKHLTSIKNNVKGTYTYFAIDKNIASLLSKEGAVLESTTPCTLEYNRGVLLGTGGVDSKVQPKILLLEDSPIKDSKEKEINKEKEEEKLRLGEFQNVALTKEQIRKLREVYESDYDLAEAVDLLDAYIETNARGKKYKNHYAVLCKHNWVYRKIYQTAPQKKGWEN